MKISVHAEKKNSAVINGGESASFLVIVEDNFEAVISAGLVLS